MCQRNCRSKPFTLTKKKIAKENFAEEKAVFILHGHIIIYLAQNLLKKLFIAQHNLLDFSNECLMINTSYWTLEINGSLLTQFTNRNFFCLQLVPDLAYKRNSCLNTRREKELETVERFNK